MSTKLLRMIKILRIEFLSNLIIFLKSSKMVLYFGTFLFI